MRGLIGAFISIGLIAAVDQHFLNNSDLTLVIGSFGASAVLVFGSPSNSLAQPFNVVVGHLISAGVGVAMFQLVGDSNWLSAALAVSLATLAMQVSRSFHPPGGATALIAVISSPEIHELGFWYILYPVGLGAIILVGVALVTNNFLNNRRWPVFWL